MGPPCCVSVKLDFIAFTLCSFAAPPSACATFAAKALPSGFDDFFSELAPSDCAFFSPGGGGIEMSTSLTGPSEDSGLSNCAVLPTASRQVDLCADTSATP